MPRKCQKVQLNLLSFFLGCVQILALLASAVVCTEKSWQVGFCAIQSKNSNNGNSSRMPSTLWPIYSSGLRKQNTFITLLRAVLSCHVPVVRRTGPLDYCYKWWKLQLGWYLDDCLQWIADKVFIVFLHFRKPLITGEVDVSLISRCTSMLFFLLSHKSVCSKSPEATLKAAQSLQQLVRGTRHENVLAQSSVGGGKVGCQCCLLVWQRCQHPSTHSSPCAYLQRI